MATADQLVELMFSWIEQRENCAKQLKKLADELETLRKNCNAAECYGSTTSVLGAASLIGAGVATVCTAGVAAPALAIVGGLYSVVGAAVSVTTKIIEHFSSSDTLKDAEKIEEKNNEIAERIQNLFEQLKVEVKRTYPSADPDEVDRHVMTSFMGAVARRSGLKLNIDFSQYESFYPTRLGIRQNSLNTFAMTAGLTVYGIFTVFSLKTAGKQSKLLIAEATKQLIKEMSAAGLKTAIKGGAMVVGGAVGMGFALPEAIDNWKDLIEKNHETEVSRSLRDTADDMLKNCSTLRRQFDDMRTALEEMDRRQREEEEKEKARRQQEEWARRQQEEWARKQQEEEEKARRQQEEEEKARRQQEEWARKQQEEEEKARRQNEEWARRQQEEKERARRQQEEKERARRQQEEQERARRQQEEKERARRRQEHEMLIRQQKLKEKLIGKKNNQQRQNLVQVKCVNLMTPTDQRHETKQCDQSEQTGREQQTNSQQTGGEQEKNSQQAEQTGGDQGDDERDDEDQERDQEEEESDSEEETEEEESDSEEETEEEESKQTGGEQKKNSQQAEQTGGDERDDEDKERDQCEINQAPPGTIRIGLLNVRSMNKKEKLISELITQNKLDLLLINETWVKPKILKALRTASPKAFKSHYRVRPGKKKGGGVANLFSEALQRKPKPSDSPDKKIKTTTVEFVVTELQHDDWDQPVLIINLYHPPGYDQQRFRRFLKEFQSLLDEVKKNYSSFIVAGDFNIRPKKGERSYTDEFYHVWPHYNLTQHVDEPTHEGGNTLDLVLTSNVEISGLIVRNDGISDHSTVYFNAKPKDTREKTEENENEEQKRFRKTEE